MSAGRGHIGGALLLALLAPAAALAQRSARTPSCPDGSTWSATGKRCVGELLCPAGAHLAADAGAPCVYDAVVCPPGSTAVDGACERPQRCPAHSQLIEGACVADAPACPSGSHASEHGCVFDAVACPDGTTATDAGCTLATAPATPAPAVVAAPPAISCEGAERARAEAREVDSAWTSGPTLPELAGLGYTELIFPGQGQAGGPSALAEVAFAYGPLYLGASYEFAGLGAPLSTPLSLLTLSVATQCNCTGNRHVWRFGVEAGEELRSQSPILRGTYRSTWRITGGFFAGVDLRAGALILGPNFNLGGNNNNNGGGNNGGGNNGGGNNGGGNGGCTGNNCSGNNSSGSGNSNGNGNKPSIGILLSGALFFGYSFN